MAASQYMPVSVWQGAEHATLLECSFARAGCAWQGTRSALVSWPEADGLRGAPYPQAGVATMVARAVRRVSRSRRGNRQASPVLTSIQEVAGGGVEDVAGWRLTLGPLRRRLPDPRNQVGLLYNALGVLQAEQSWRQASADCNAPGSLPAEGRRSRGVADTPPASREQRFPAPLPCDDAWQGDEAAVAKCC